MPTALHACGRAYLACYMAQSPGALFPFIQKKTDATLLRYTIRYKVQAAENYRY